MTIAETSIKVRYAETDQMGVVYHANYLVWFELGRTALNEELNLDYVAIENEGVVAPVLDLAISYKKPVRYGQDAVVRTWISEYSGLRLTYSYEIFNGDGELAVTGQSVHTFVKKDTFRPLSLKRHFKEWHEVYERAKE